MTWVKSTKKVEFIGKIFGLRCDQCGKFLNWSKESVRRSRSFGVTRLYSDAPYERTIDLCGHCLDNRKEKFRNYFV